MTRFLLEHRHEPGDCPVCFSAWKGFESPLRRVPAMASCARGDHAVWWTVDAEDAEAALAQLPPWVAERTRATEVTLLPLP